MFSISKQSQKLDTINYFKGNLKDKFGSTQPGISTYSSQKCC